MVRLLAAACALLSAVLIAQDPPVPAVQDLQPTVASVQARIDQVKQDTSLTEEQRTPLLEPLNAALEHVREVERHAAAKEQFAAMVAGAADRQKEVEERLTKFVAPERPTAASAGALSLADLEQQVSRCQQAVTSATDNAAALDKEVARRLERRTAVADRLVEARKLFDAVPAAPAVTEDTRLLELRRLRLQTARLRWTNEIAALEAELPAYRATDRTLSLQRDLATRTAAAANGELEAWREILQQRRAAAAVEAERTARETATKAAANEHALVKDLAQRNAELAAALTALAEAAAEAGRQHNAATGELAQIGKELEQLTQRVERAQHAESTGARLRNERGKLGKDLQGVRARAATRSATLERAHEATLAYQLEREDALTASPADMVATASPPVDPASAEIIRDKLEALLNEHRQMLIELSDGYNQLANTLGDIEALDERIATLAARKREFVNRHVLWIRSSAPIWQLSLDDTLAATRWLLSPATIEATGQAAYDSALQRPWFFVLGALLLGVLLARPLLTRRLTQAGDQAAKGSNVSYGPTAKALVLSAALALPLPLLLLVLSELLEDGAEPFAFGLYHLGIVTMFIAILLVVARKGGLGERHFQWSADLMSWLRRWLWLLPPAYLLACAAVVVGRRSDQWLGSLSSLLLLPHFAIVTLVGWRLLHPSSGILARRGSDRTLVWRLRGLWFLLGVGIPASFFGMAMLGYEYTALQLSGHLVATIGALVLLLLAQHLVVRGLLLAGRKLQIEQARARQAAAKAAAPAGASEISGEIVEDRPLDPYSIAQQTHALLRAAIVIAAVAAAYQIWVDVMPALGVLRNVTLWGVAPDVVTLADFLFAGLILLLTYVAAANLPGLLELIVLQRLKLHSGGRNAITTLARYLLTAIGLGIAFTTIGMGWSKVQWLVAAVSVGLGFGLQEIFANFVSGLILLFEQPVRVGDIVTVGTVSGRVTRIRIRATTIVDWDRKELVVPNREFVTTQFVNWTLTDSILRITIDVGVAYGTDTKKAIGLLLRAAAESPYVLKDPAPQAVFTKFADSSLSLQLRVYVESLDTYANAQTDTHQRIAELLQQHGIEMSFPQRDLHLRSAEPLIEFVRRADAQRRESVESD